MKDRIVMTAAISLLLATVIGAQQQPAERQADSAAEVGRIAQEVAAAGQRAAREAQERELRQVVPLKVQVVLAKYAGDKKTSSLPYDLTLASDNAKVGVRMGSKIPLPSSTLKPGPDTLVSVNYHDVGTNIDCQARSLDNGRFSVTITIEDTSVSAPGQRNDAAPGLDAPMFRSYRSTNTLILRDGQSAQFTAASDKVTGEVIKADVTLTVVK